MEHSVRRIFSRRKVIERELTNFSPVVRLLQKAQRFLFRYFSELFVGPLSVSPLPIAEVDEHIESRRAWANAFQFRESASMPGNLQHSLGVPTAPFFEDIFVEQHDVFRDLRFA